MPVLAVGTSARPFELPDQQGDMHGLARYRGRTVVLYFYPKDDTSGCTLEACQFRDQLPDFSSVDAVVLGVSPDSVKSHQKFAGKYALSFPLLADVPGPDGVPPTCNAYGVWVEKSMYGRSYMGVARTTYLIDGDGVVRARWDGVKVDGHAQAVLEAVRSLNAGQDPSSFAGPATMPASARPRTSDMKKTSSKKAPSARAKTSKKAASKKTASKTPSSNKSTGKNAPKKAVKKASGR